MHPQTKAIARFETEEDAKRAGYTVPLSAELAELLNGVDREQRLETLRDVAPDLAKRLQDELSATLEPRPAAETTTFYGQSYRENRQELRARRKGERKARKAGRR